MFILCTGIGTPIMPFQSKNDQVIKLKNQREQMTLHLKIDRVRMTKTLPEMIQFCNQRIMEDPLVHPVKENPFKEKKLCTIL